LEVKVAEGGRRDIDLQGESTLSKMARGITEETGVEGNMQVDTQGDTHLLIEHKVNEMAKEMTEETGAEGDVHLHVERRMNEMAKKMFEDD